MQMILSDCRLGSNIWSDAAGRASTISPVTEGHELEVTPVSGLESNAGEINQS